jgi:hypothetical protein
VRQLKIAALVIFCFAVPVLCWYAIRMAAGPQNGTPNPSYAELVTILLTGVTVSLAMLAIVIGSLAIWGYQGIRAEATALAKITVESTVTDQVARAFSDAGIKDKMEKQAELAIARALRRRVGMMYPAAFAERPTDGPDLPQDRIADEYPKGGDQ